MADGTKLPTSAEDATGAAAGLSGLRILDLGRYIAGPFCAALLADQGAEVIRIEPPAGAPDREVMPIGLLGRGALYLQMNRNKKSLALDLDTASGRAAFEKLVATADAIIVNLPPAALRRARLDYDSLRACRPDIVLCTISAYGPEGDSRDRIGFAGTGTRRSFGGAIGIARLRPGRNCRPRRLRGWRHNTSIAGTESTDAREWRRRHDVYGKD